MRQQAGWRGWRAAVVAIGLAAVAGGASGCATAVSTALDGPTTLGGTSLHIEKLGAGGWETHPIVLVDLPLSMAADTVLLPVGITADVVRLVDGKPRLPKAERRRLRIF